MRQVVNIGVHLKRRWPRTNTAPKAASECIGKHCFRSAVDLCTGHDDSIHVPIRRQSKAGRPGVKIPSGPLDSNG
jgi:hypothetical protein